MTQGTAALFVGLPHHPLPIPPDPQHPLAPAAVAFMVGGDWVAVDAADWLRIAAAGFHWCRGLSGGRPVPMIARAGVGRMIVARVIAGAGEWQKVGYRNGDRFDLRRGNLILSARRFAQPRRVPLLVV